MGSVADTGLTMQRPLDEKVKALVLEDSVHKEASHDGVVDLDLPPHTRKETGGDLEHLKEAEQQDQTEKGQKKMSTIPRDVWETGKIYS